MRPSVVIVLVGLAVTGSAWGAEPEAAWPQFRGVRRDGVAATTSPLLERWPPAGPRVLWRRPLGQGFSGLTVAGGQLVTMYGTEDGDRRVEVAAAFDPDTGGDRWRVTLDPEFEDQFGNGPRSSPTVVGDTAYCLSSHGRLVALDVTDGTIRWEVRYRERFGSTTPRWGFSGSPLAEGDRLIVEVGAGQGKAFAALDRTTGEVLWQVGDGPPGYSSPLAVTIHGQRQIVFLHRDGAVVAVSPAGEVLWQHTFAKRAEILTMPVFAPPDRLFFSAPARAGALLLRVTGPTEVEEVWRVKRMRTHWSTAVVSGDHVYGFDNAALKCLEVSTGKLCWSQRGMGKGSLVIGDDKLFILSDQGKAVLASADPEGFRELGSLQVLEGRSWTAPTLVGNRLYVRNLTHMACLEVGPASPGEAER